VTEVAPPRPPAARGAFTEHLSLLVDEATREYILGDAERVAREAGYKYIRQGEIVRELIAEAITARYEKDPTAYEQMVRRGREVKAVPAEGTTPRRA
jgi:hypothetical protein